MVECDVIVYDISQDPDQIDEAIWAINEIHNDLDKIETQKVFILISTVMTWAKSKPIDPVSLRQRCLSAFFPRGSHLFRSPPGRSRVRVRRRRLPETEATPELQGTPECREDGCTAWQNGRASVIIGFWPFGALTERVQSIDLSLTHFLPE